MSHIILFILSLILLLGIIKLLWVGLEMFGDFSEVESIDDGKQLLIMSKDHKQSFVTRWAADRRRKKLVERNGNYTNL